MNRLSFNMALENRLRDVYEEDKRDAIDYYNEIFDEIGLTDNDEVPEEFQDIDKIVKDIKADMKINRVMEKSKNSGNNIWKNIGIIFLAFLAVPVLLPVFGVFLGLFLGLGGMIIGLFAGVVGLFIGIVHAVINIGTFPLGMLGILLY